MAVSVTIWHNPRCSKSRQTLELLRENGVEPGVRLYLEDAPTRAELETALTALGLPPSGLIRTGEAEYRELALKGKDEDALLSAMAAHPRLIERPVVFKDVKAALGRPPENVLAIL
ncbi:arsenate reductase (glutaredoxin) [Pseudooceanicola sp.]|uniref:arsenate reductase (glutaredoxin) n=1 Tax=Pseudooceanicola sp. TaxID=1914328 RepID=UPI0040589B3C